MEDALAGDSRAMEGLVHRMICIPRMLDAMDARRTPPLGPAAVDDVAQVARVRIFRDLGTFCGRSSLETWFHGYAFNSYREARRDRAIDAHRRVPWDHADRASSGAGGSAPPADQRPADRDEAAWLLRALDRLGLDVRRIFELHLVDGLSFREIAEQLGLTAAATKARYHRAIQRIREAHPDRTESSGAAAATGETSR